MTAQATGHIRNLTCRVLAALALITLTGAVPAEARRLALVLGNGGYETLAPLPNAVNDATDVAEALTRLGFEVTLLTDTASDTFETALANFAVEAETAESTVFYYSGHAFQMSGINYLVPVAAELSSRDALRDETWNLDGIIARLQNRNRQTLVFLDACRTDPLAPSVRGSGAAADGLARMQTGVGTFVAFATEPGAVTYDGLSTERNSPFTASLLDHIETPAISVSDMMIEVRNQVEEATLRRQTPWDQSSLRSQFYFVPAEETRQELSEADYELLAQLDPEDRKKFLDLLRDSGFSAESLDEAEAAIAVAEANLEVVADAATTIAAPTAPVVVADATVVSGDLEGLVVVEGNVSITEARTAELEPKPEIEVALAGPAPEPAPPVDAPVKAESEPAPPLPDASLPDPAIAVAASGKSMPDRTPLPVPDAFPVDVVTIDPALATLPDVANIAPVRLAALDTRTRDISINEVTISRMRVVGRALEPDSDTNRAVLAAIDPALVLAPEASVLPEDLALAVQGELKRLGCYQMGVDGDWGKGSRTALTSYYLAKKSVPDSLEPTGALYTALAAEPKVVCAIRVAKAKPKGGAKAKAKATTARSGTGVKKRAPQEQKKKIEKALIGGTGSF